MPDGVAVAAGVVLAVSVVGLAYIYGGYALLVRGLAYAFGRAAEEPLEEPARLPSVTVFLSALDEEDLVEARIENVFASDYPSDRLACVVVSDGSTDQTPERVRDYARSHPEHAVELIEFARNRGRAAAQNEVVTRSRSDVLIATDVETAFARDTVRRLAGAFVDPRVAVAGAQVQFAVASDDDGTGSAYALYRGTEAVTREAESRLGLLTKTDGPCTAFRRTVWEPLEPFEDVDQSIVLVARSKGLRSVHVPDAVAFDRSNTSAAQDMRQRSRMTRKALLSSRHRWPLARAVRDPVFTWAFASHKLLRFASPVLVLLALVSGSVLATAVGPERVAIVAGGAVAAAAVAFVAAPQRARHLGRLARSFVVAQIGFGLGLIGWLRGDRSGGYRPTRKHGSGS